MSCSAMCVPKAVTAVRMVCDVDLGEPPVERDAAQAEGVALVGERDPAVGVRRRLLGDADDAGLAGGLRQDAAGRSACGR